MRKDEPVSVAPRLSRVEFVPEIQLYLFEPTLGLFDPHGGEYRSDRPPPGAAPPATAR